jgi:predicted O-linked N-acetylglucosamine transferase (SPINDLY family)
MTKTPLPKPNLRQQFDQLSHLFQMGQLAQANVLLENVLADHPDNVNFLHLGGLIKQNIGEFALAEKLLSTAHALAPEQPDITYNLAVFYVGRGQAAEALPLLLFMAELAPDRGHIWLSLGHSYRQLGQLTKALDSFEKAKKLGGSPDLAGIIAMTKRQCALWDDTNSLSPEECTAALAPVFLDDPYQQLAVTKKAAASIKPVARYDAKPLPNQSRLRIGYLSNDLHTHATSFLIAELFALHDRSAFEIFVYSYGPDDSSPLRTRIKNSVEHWVECRDQNCTPAVASSWLRWEPLRRRHVCQMKQTAFLTL